MRDGDIEQMSLYTSTQRMSMYTSTQRMSRGGEKPSTPQALACKQALSILQQETQQP